MIRTIATALLFTWMGTPVSPAGTVPQPEPQPEPQINTAPKVFFYSSAGRSYLGVDIQDVTAERVGPLKLKEERGVEVTMVDQDAPAGKAGVKEHDVILEFNGAAVESEEQLRRLIREVPPGRTITLGISRDGNPMKISVQLGDRGKIEARAMPRVAPMPRMPAFPKSAESWSVEGFPSYAFQFQTYSSALGIQTENLGRQLGEFFGVKDGEGVLVRSVEKGSVAEKAGLKAGDVIVRADNEKLSGRTDLSHVLRNHREGGKLTLGIVREKHEQTIVVELPARGPEGSRRHSSSEEMESVESTIIAIEDMIDDVEPEIDQAREMASLKLRVNAEGLQQKIKEMKPALEKSLRDGQSELRRVQKLLQEELKKHNTMI